MSVTDNHELLVGGPAIEAREARLEAGADDLAERRPSLVGGRNVLLAAAGTLVTLGLTSIVLAWVGAAHSTLIAEQVPYLISGGLLGLALAVVGAITFFAHWLTVLVREARAQDIARTQQHQELLAELRTLRGQLARQEESNGAARGDSHQRPLRRAPGRS